MVHKKLKLFIPIEVCASIIAEVFSVEDIPLSKIVFLIFSTDVDIFILLLKSFFSKKCELKYWKWIFQFLTFEISCKKSIQTMFGPFIKLSPSAIDTLLKKSNISSLTLYFKCLPLKSMFVEWRLKRLTYFELDFSLE